MAEENENPFDSPEDMKREAAGRAPTATSEEEGPSLEDTLAGLGTEAAEDSSEIVPAPDAEQPPAEPEATGEEPAEEPSSDEETTGKVRYRNPETGQFISAEEAREAGLDPETLQTDEEAADELFGEDEDETPEEEDRLEPVVLELGDDEALAIDVESEDDRAAIEALKTDAEAARKYREHFDELEQLQSEVESDKRELDLLYEEIRENPTTFLASEVPEGRRTEVATRLLAMADQETFDQIASQMEEWLSNPAERRAAAADARAEMSEMKATRQEKRIQAREVQRNKREILSGMRAAAEQVDPADREFFQQDLLDDIVRHAEENELTTLPIEDVVQIPRVRRRLQRYGVSPKAMVRAARNGASGPASEARGEDGRRVVRAAPGGEDEADLAAEAERYRRSGEVLRKARARRKEVAKTAPAGAGATPSEARPPKDADLGEAFDFLDKRSGRGA